MLQGLTTAEPTDDMIEVAIASVEAVFDWKEFIAHMDDEQEKPVADEETAEEAQEKEEEKKEESEVQTEESGEDIEILDIDEIEEEEKEILEKIDQYFEDGEQ